MRRFAVVLLLPVLGLMGCQQQAVRPELPAENPRIIYRSLTAQTAATAPQVEVLPVASPGVVEVDSSAPQELNFDDLHKSGPVRTFLPLEASGPLQDGDIARVRRFLGDVEARGLPDPQFVVVARAEGEAGGDGMSGEVVSALIAEGKSLDKIEYFTLPPVNGVGVELLAVKVGDDPTKYLD